MAYTEFYVNPSATGASNFNAGSTDGDVIFSADNGNFNSTTGVYTVVGGASTASVQVGMWASIFLNTTTGNTTIISRVTAVAATTITVSTTVRLGAALTTVNSTSGNVNIRVGGAWSGPSGASGFPLTYTGATVFFTGTARNTNGDIPRCNFKDSTYSITAGITWTPATTAPAVIEGYTTTPGDGGLAIFSGLGITGSSASLLTLGGTGCYVKNFIFTDNGDTGVADGIIVSGTSLVLERIGTYNIRGRGILISGTNSAAIECEAYNCNISNTASYSGIYASGTATTTIFIRCISWNNSGSNSNGYIVTGVSPSFMDCIAYNNGSAGFRLSIGAAVGAGRIFNCISDKNSGSGIDFSSTGTTGITYYIENCILTRNGAYGINNSLGNNVVRLAAIYNCLFGTNTSGTVGGLQSWTEGNNISLPLNDSPFVNADAGDFDLNTSVSAGISALNSGRGTFLQSASAGFSGTLSYNDIGASQDFQSLSTSTEKTFLFC